QAAGSAESPYDIPPLSLESIGATTPQAVGGDVSLDADDLAALGAAGWDAPSGLDEIDLLDELTPPFMRHEEASDDTALASALDVEALRALVDVRDGRDGGPLPLDGPNAAELEAAFRDRAVDLPLLDVDDLITPSVGNAPIESLDIEPFSVDSLLSQAPNFDETEPPSFLPEPLLSSETLEAPHETRQSSEPAPIADETTPAAATAGATDEWPVDAAPEVLIDGEWRDEHMGDLVSGEVSAIVSPGSDRPNRTGPRFDDLSAALMWPPSDDDAAALPSALHGTGASDAFFTRMHTPRSTLSFGGVEAQLRRRLELDPGNLVLRRQLGEALLDQGDREEGLLELDLAMRGFEQINDLESARGVADIVLRLIPTSVRHHQKRVEYAVRTNDRLRLVEAYVELADSLFRSGEPEKARVVYSRVLELSPGNGRARFALGMLTTEEEAERAETSRPAAGSIPMSPDYVVTLFDRSASASGSVPAASSSDSLASISADIPVVSDSLFILPPSSPETGDERGAGESASTVDVGDLVTQEREQSDSADDARAAADASGGAAAPAAVEDVAGTDADQDEDAGQDAEGSVAPFPAPSLDDEIDAAFATPPVVEAAVDDGLPGLPAADYDFAGTPPLGAAALATPFSSEEMPLVTSLTPPLVPAVPGVSRPTPVVAPLVQPPSGDDDFVDLGSWLREDEPVRTTRMVAAEATPTGDEQADFDEMLRRFKQGVAANVDEEDYDSHYDLGVAYKEMGLTDEAIAEFQKALRGDSHRVRSYEALGQCFVEKGQLQVAVTLLRRATETTGADDQQLVGVLYLLGYASEVMARHADALGYYQRVFAVDIEFRDVAQRVAAMEHVTQ
ncbi:MAG TPA: tetratricopeptide repeat protein, partial [Gemmatimonadaceae bacterium]|nr:tetratricopeptide repeat protein [Gemmatimonadaceae bacterium]